MADEDQTPDVQALVDAAVKEAVAKSLAEMQKPLSRQEARNVERDKRRARYGEERQERIDAKKLSKEPEISPKRDPVDDKANDSRTSQNQNLGQQEPRVSVVAQGKPETERKLTIAETVGPLHSPAPRNGFNPREFLYGAAIKASSINHPWRVYNNGTTVQEGSPEVLGKYGVIGGTVYSQGGTIVVADEPELIGAAETGFVYLEIVRDPESREMTSASIKHGVSVPDSDYDTQCRPLAVVYGKSGERPLQLQFQEIRVWELMLVENGEFALDAFDMGSRASYALPP